ESMDVRFIDNYCIGREEQYSNEVNADWLADSAASIDRLIDQNVADHQESSEAGPYTGPSGIATSLMQAVSAGLLSEDRGTSIIQKYRNLIPTRVRQPVYLCGGLGDTVARLHLDRTSGSDSVTQFIDRYLDDLLDDRTADEILYGRAGVLMAAKEAESISGRPVLSARTGRIIIEKILTNGRHCAKEGGEGGPPLMWCWHKTKYLGAAHGAAGILHSLLLHWNELQPTERKEVEETSKWMRGVEEKDCAGHWESSVRLAGSGREKRLVHWCHGATGMVGFLITAHRVLKDEKYLEAALRAGELIWREGLLKKGPGLCHGVGGSGLALLQVYGATDDSQWLRRAKCYARMMMDKTVQRAQRTPDSPVSLFEGWAGGMSLLSGIAKAERGSENSLNVFPFMPISV
ncbi:hypothetical protein PFISCL1PPCAC_15795, partial [Pristionchus fissidentatus]